MEIICPHCGGKMPSSATYCGLCGKRLGKEDTDARKRELLGRIAQIKGWFEANEIKDPWNYSIEQLKKHLNDIKDNISNIDDVIISHENLFPDLTYIKAINHLTFVKNKIQSLKQFLDQYFNYFKCKVDLIIITKGDVKWNEKELSKWKHEFYTIEHEIFLRIIKLCNMLSEALTKS